MNRSPTEVFISHAPTDSRFAGQLARSLSKIGIESRTDADTRQKGKPEQGVAALAEALGEADCLVVVISDEAVSSPNLNFEVGAAIGQKKKVIPVLLSRSAGRRFRVDWLTAALADSVVAEEMPASKVAQRIAQRLVHQTALRKNRWDVTARGAGWEVRRAGSSRPIARTSSQREASHIARDAAVNAGGGEIVIHSRNGTIRRKDEVRLH